MESDTDNARIVRWTQRLLDLSLRNRLLNARECRQILPLECEGLGALEDRLSGGASVPVESSNQTARTTNSLRTSLDEDEMRRRLKEIYRLAKTDMEESGVNALYLALGFLKWRPKGSGEKLYRAPLLLVPVQLSRKNVREGYVLACMDDDTVLNATLVEFLRVEFGIQVSGVDPLPEDASGVAVDQVMQSFREAVKGMDGWSVECDAALGHFSFGKFVMWKDLSSRVAALAAHPLVAHLMKGGGGYDDGVDVPDGDELAAAIAYDETFAPLSADSSQLAAVLLSAKGKSFVLHGPPGTGKSQTITNLIAHNLALGRRVLFVSEKKAALDVVHRRLEKVGLKPFCLELHSNKSGKGDVLAQFAEALDYVDKGVPLEWGKTTSALTRLRSGLDATVAALHRRQPNGLTAYECFASKMSGDVKTFPFAGITVSEWSEQDIAAGRDLAAKAASDWSETTPDAVNALKLVKTFSWNPAMESETCQRLAALKGKGAFMRGVSVLFGCGPVTTGKGFASRFDGFAKDYPARLQAAIDAMGESRGVMRYRESADKALECLGEGFVKSLENGDVSPDDVVESYDRSIAAKTLDEILAKEPSLASFSGRSHEEQILDFRKLDDEYAALVQHVIRARIAFEMPGGRLGDCPEGCELGVLRRECRKKSRQKPIRKLLAETRGIVGKLKPCFLMSPLSVAQYLPPEASFDLVVFDEASQIPVWDAIGVIARAKQCVVVGDPKQMPPTSFFQKGESAEADDEDATEDLESILDECLAAGLHSSYLSWHYRSRHESLIAFSNREYYGGRLFTFPAAKTTPDLGVRHLFVQDGVYDAKASRTNRAEAEALVDYIFGRLAEGRRRSVGVVTFSMAQKNLIEDLLEERRAADSRFEDFFTGDGAEPFFVKNLENVQGDEREVILFSVGYAKGPDGKFMMNFGPLNRAGGERRLNVAVTRAKEQVVVFSSCRSAEIDLSRTQSVGAKHLKAFLEYAEAGGVASDSESGSSRDAFADIVAKFIASRGYVVKRGVGSSARRIDVGVSDANSKGRFIAAVECDGEAYADATVVRDREKLRAGVLRSLGWNVLRVWSADWALDRARAEERLAVELEAIGREKSGMLPEPKFDPTVTFPRKRSQKRTEPAKVSLENVPAEELRRTMNEVERDLGRCETDTLYRETVKRYGYKTLSPKARAILDRARIS